MRIEKIKSAREIFSIMRDIDGDSFVASISRKSYSHDEIERQYHDKIIAKWIRDGGVTYRKPNGREVVVNPHSEIGARFIRRYQRKVSMN